MMLLSALLLALPAQVPPTWSCDSERWADGACDCGCDEDDVFDCASTAAFDCAVDHCGPDQTPAPDDNARCNDAGGPGPTAPADGGCSQNSSDVSGALVTLLGLFGWRRRR